MLAFCACIFLFQLGNAGALPFAFAEIQARTHGTATDTIVSVALVVSQLVAAVVSPGVGRLAHRSGRRIVLFAGIAFLVVRCLVLAVSIDEYVVVALEALDGLTGAVIGVIVPLVVADLTHRGGRFNFAMGVAGLAMILGAGLGTTLTGFVAQHAGATAAFLTLAAAGAAGCLCTMFVMPETARFPLKVVWKGITRHAV
jgi:MFS family permease